MDFSIGVSYKTSKVLPAESVVRENNSEPANPKMLGDCQDRSVRQLLILDWESHMGVKPSAS